MGCRSELLSMSSLRRSVLERRVVSLEEARRCLSSTSSLMLEELGLGESRDESDAVVGRRWRIGDRRPLFDI